MPQFQSSNFRLESGDVLPQLTVAYEIYGSLNSDASNVILVAHGATSSHHAAGKVTLDRRMGWWDEVIGPERLFDTDKYCVVSSNMLGSCYGTTGPASVDPATGRVYGPWFPRITFLDIVTVQYLVLRSLGVKRLLAVAGSSLGGYQAFQWAVAFPEFMAGILALDTAPRDLFDSATAADRLHEELSGHENWNGGDYYRLGGMDDIMTDIRIRTLKSYGFEEQLKDIAGPQAREATLRQVAHEWAQEFDANSLITLRRAMGTYDVERDLGRIRAKLLYVLADSDEWFPASIGKDVMQKLERCGVDATFHKLNSPYGHYATTREPEKWTPVAARFLQGLEAYGE